MTELLYWKDPYIRTFQGTIVEIERNTIVLDKTAFYPQSGNQLCDKGYFEQGEKSYEIQKVSKEGEKVYHQIDLKSINEFNIGDLIIGNIDWEYRYGIMRAHSSQHLLSAIIKNKFDIDTSHANILFEEVMLQIAEEITENQLKQSLEELIRITTIEDHNFETHVTSKEKLQKYSIDLRGHVPDDDKIRLVEVPGFDLICCGGTHVKNSTEIGLIFLYEFKKGRDIKYVLGKKATELFSHFNVDLIASSNLLGFPYSDFFSIIHKQSSEFNQLELNYLKVASDLLDFISKFPNFQIKECNIGILEIDLDYRVLQKQFKTFPKNYVIIVLKPESKIIIISNCEKIKANEVLDHFIQTCGGRGGGSPFSAQGALDNVPEDIPALVKALYK